LSINHLWIGILGDVCWLWTRSQTAFVTYKPVIGRAAAGTTGAYCGYDADNLYLAFRCPKTTPSQIKATPTLTHCSGGRGRSITFPAISGLTE